jgi:hypothetical protein
VGESEYAVNKNNPVLNNDPDGDCADCPKFKANVNLKLGMSIGKHNSIRANLSITSGIEGKFYQFRNEVSLGVYGGGLGTSSTGSKFGFDLSTGFAGVIGIGKDNELPQYGINYDMRSAFTNSFEKSITFGQFINYNSALRMSTRIGLFGMRINNVSVSSTNDVNQFPYFGKGTDQGWTGGIIFSANTKKGLLEFGYESFTGIGKGFPQVLINGRAYYNQDKYQRSLNKANTFLSLPGLNNYSFSIIKDGYLQNFIHDHQKNEKSIDGRTPRFPYD